MRNRLKWVRVIAALGLLLTGSALAQQTTPSHTVAVGKGSGNVGFTGIGPGTSGQLLIGQGTSSDPSWKSITGSCTLNSAGAMSCSASGITVGTTTISGGSSGNVEFNNSGVLGEKSVSGTGNVCLTTNCTLVTPALGTPSALVLTNSSGLPASALPGGVGANVLNTQTTGYSIATTDCGKTVQAGTGSTGQFTVTLPSVSGFSTTCIVQIINGDTAHGKLLAGFPTGFGSILWPRQSGTVGIVNGAWATMDLPGRWFTTSGVTFQVNHASGSDSNDCLGTGAGACATIQHAYTLIQNDVDCQSTVPNIQVANETFTETVNTRAIGCLGNALVNIVGNTASPGSSVWTCPANSWCLSARNGAITDVGGFKFVAAGTGAIALDAQLEGGIGFNNVEFGDFTGGADLVFEQQGAIVYDAGTFVVSGNCGNACWFGTGNGYIQVGGATINVPNALTFSNWIWLTGPGYLRANNVTFTGTGAGSGSTGKKYTAWGNAVLDFAGGSTTTVPGATAGVTATGGQVL